MKKHTTMRITNETKNRIKDLAYTPSESLENIIIRLLESKCGVSEIYYLIKSTTNEFQLKISVDWGDSRENLYYYDEKNNKFSNPPKLNTEDKLQQESYDSFLEKILDIPNIHSMLMILSEGEYIRAGDLIIERL